MTFLSLRENVGCGVVAGPCVEVGVLPESVIETPLIQENPDGYCPPLHQPPQLRRPRNLGSIRRTPPTRRAVL